MDAFMNLLSEVWNLFGEKKGYAILLTLIVAIPAFLIGFFACYKFYARPSELSHVAQNVISPPTNKEEDLSDIAKKLTIIENDIHLLINGVETKITKDNLMLQCGINDGELNEWEASVSGNNTLNLQEGDEVLLINSSSLVAPSAKFKVKFIRENISDKRNDTELYINNKSAKFLQIAEPNQIGVFKLRVQKIK